MRKQLFIFMVFFFMSTGFIKAQEEGWAFGAKVVPMLSWSGVKSSEDYSFDNKGAKFGIGVGPSIKNKISETFEVGVDLIFSWQGASFTQEYIGQDTSKKADNLFDVKLQYLQIPVNLSSKFFIVDYTQLIINFGIIPAVNLSSNADRTNNFTDEIREDITLKSYFNLYLTAGLGASYEITEGVNVSGIFQYNVGLVDIWHDNSNEEMFGKKAVESFSLKNHFFALNLGLYIDI